MNGVNCPCTEEVVKLFVMRTFEEEEDQSILYYIILHSLSAQLHDFIHKFIKIITNGRLF